MGGGGLKTENKNQSVLIILLGWLTGNAVNLKVGLIAVTMQLNKAVCFYVDWFYDVTGLK